jgi:hypothetical protein
MHSYSTSEFGVHANDALSAQLLTCVNVSQQNLVLLQTYGSNAWRIQNHLLEATAKQTEKAVEELKELTVEVNRERKNVQVCKKECQCLPHTEASAGSSW